MDTKTLCLGVLSMGDASGYKIKKTFEEGFSHFFVAGFGSIYPALAELSREGLVEFEAIEQERRPAKKVYSLTPAGREALSEALAGEAPRHKVRSEFLVLTFFSHLLCPGRLSEVLDQRCEALEESLRHSRAIRKRPDLSAGVRFTAGYGEAVSRAALAYLREHRPELEQGKGQE